MITRSTPSCQRVRAVIPCFLARAPSFVSFAFPLLLAALCVKSFQWNCLAGEKLAFYERSARAQQSRVFLGEQSAREIRNGTPAVAANFSLLASSPPPLSLGQRNWGRDSALAKTPIILKGRFDEQTYIRVTHTQMRAPIRVCVAFGRDVIKTEWTHIIYHGSSKHHRYKSVRTCKRNAMYTHGYLLAIYLVALNCFKCTII